MLEELYLLLVVVLAVLASLTATQYYRRRRGLIRLAHRLQLRFTANDRLGLLERLGGLYLTQRGHAARAYNIIYGRYQQRQVFAFDYGYETGLGPRRANLHFQVIVCRMEVVLPTIAARRGEYVELLGRFRVFSRIKTNDMDFDQRFNIYADNPAAAAKLLTPSLRREILQGPEMDWEINDKALVFYCEGNLSPGKISALIDHGIACCRLITGPSD